MEVKCTSCGISKEYDSSNYDGNVNVDGVAEDMSVWCLHYEVTLFPFLYSVRRQQRHEGREIEVTFWRELYHRVCGMLSLQVASVISGSL